MAAASSGSSRALAPQALLEALAAHVLHHDVRRPAGAAAVVHGDDGAVVEAGGRLRLDAEALDELVVGGQATP